MTAKTRIILGCIGILVIAMSGCQSSHSDMIKFLKAHEHEVSAIEYRVGIPDAIAISAPRVLEIDGTRATIRPDGKIALRLLGPVKITGLTEKEIAAKLTRLLLPYYEDPKVRVTVAAYRSKKIYLSGQIGGYGAYAGNSGYNGSNGGGGGTPSDAFTSIPYTGRDTVLDVLAESGMSFIAWREQVKVIRSSPNEGERPEIVIDVGYMMRTGDTSKNVLLQPNDILHVPPTPLGWVGLRVQELMFPFRPIVSGLQYPNTLANTFDVYDDDN